MMFYRLVTLRLLNFITETIQVTRAGNTFLGGRMLASPILEPDRYIDC